jgi:alkanesulfonate monooxygenase SsuD/methylene tetrahydromethanopterin reductase-like flavin-dependent oxidoreductase (luciferase family)
VGVAPTFGFQTRVAAAEDLAALESLPFDALWVGGHVAARTGTPEVLMQLARLAALTTRVHIGTAALLLPLYPPGIVAKQVADVDRVSGGRVIIGVGVGGEHPEDFEAAGVPMRERGRRTDEAMPLLRRLWAGEQVTHHGRFYDMSGVRLTSPGRPGGPPLVVTGRSPAAMARAGALGDGWMPYLYSPERFGKSVVQVRAAAERAGRDLGDFAWMAFVCTNVQDDAAAARADATTFFGTSFGQDVGPFLDRIAAVGSPVEVAARIGEFLEAGASHVIVAPSTAGDPLAMATLFAADVMPRLGAGVVPTQPA